MSFLYVGPKNISVIQVLKKIGKISFFKQIHYPQILKIINNFDIDDIDDFTRVKKFYK